MKTLYQNYEEIGKFNNVVLALQHLNETKEDFLLVSCEIDEHYCYDIAARCDNKLEIFEFK